MRIVFIGCVNFSRIALERLLERRADVVGICTLRESTFNSDHCDLGAISEKHHIPCNFSADLNGPEQVQWIKSLQPDVIFCFGWSKLLKKELISIPPMGVVGFHPSALPENRGRHPLVWALVLGLKETGATFFFMDEGTDSGDILSQRRISIDDDDDAGTLYEKVTVSALNQIDSFLPLLSSGGYCRIKQNDAISNTWRKRSRADGLIDWRMSARSIHNLVRGLAKPYIGASFEAQGREIKVWKTEVVSADFPNDEPGKIVMRSGTQPVVKCGEQAISLLVTEPSIDLDVGSYL